MNNWLKPYLAGVLTTLVVVGLSFVIYRGIKSDLVLPEPSRIPQPTLTVRDNKNPTLNEALVPQKPQSPSVSFDASGAISETDKTEIVKKALNPLVDYYKDAGQGQPISISVTANSGASNLQYPFSVQVTFDSQAVHGFLIAKQAGELQWWTPECMGPCLMTDEFRGKYPEIVKILEGK